MRSVTIKDVARLAGTSPTAVSFVINGKAQGMVRQETQQRIRRAIQETGYRRYHAAAGLRLNRSFTVNLCVARRVRGLPLLGRLSHHGLVSRMAHRLCRTGYGVQLVEVEPHEDADVPLDPAAAATVGIQLGPHETPRLQKLSQRFDSPLILLDCDRGATPVKRDRVWDLQIERQRSFEAATRSLIETGSRRPVMLDITLSATHTQLKRQGYESAMQKADLEPLPLYEITSPGASDLRQTLAAMLGEQTKLDGLILTDNYLAALVVEMLGRPQLPVLGFGDEGLAECCDPPIPYMQLPINAMADAAAEGLLAHLDAGQPLPHGIQRYACECVQPDAYA
jgi:LacI family transcriptional regulator